MKSTGGTSPPLGLRASAPAPRRPARARSAAARSAGSAPRARPARSPGAGADSASSRSTASSCSRASNTSMRPARAAWPGTSRRRRRGSGRPGRRPGARVEVAPPVEAWTRPRAIDANGRLEQVGQAPGDPHGVVLVGQVDAQGDELVAAEAAHGVAGRASALCSRRATSRSRRRRARGRASR